MGVIPPLIEGKPHSVLRIGEKPPEPRPLDGWMKRFGRYPKGTVLPETQVQVCPRRRVRDLMKIIPPRYYEKNLEQNQQIAHCCRHPELMTVAAFKSHPEEQRPDIYIFYCDGLDEMGRRHHHEVRRHVRFFIGVRDREGERRPVWS